MTSSPVEGPRFLPRSALFVLAAHALEVADRREGSVFRFHEKTFRGSIKQSQFLTKALGTHFRQRLNQVLQHGTQTPCDLNTLAAKVTNFGDCQLNKIFPVWSAVDESKPAGR